MHFAIIGIFYIDLNVSNAPFVIYKAHGNTFLVCPILSIIITAHGLFFHFYSFIYFHQSTQP